MGGLPFFFSVPVFFIFFMKNFVLWILLCPRHLSFTISQFCIFSFFLSFFAPIMVSEFSSSITESVRKVPTMVAVQLKMVSEECAWKSYMHSTTSQKFPQHCL